jgi:hypothetical protein
MDTLIPSPPPPWCLGLKFPISVWRRRILPAGLKSNPEWETILISDSRNTGKISLKRWGNKEYQERKNIKESSEKKYVEKKVQIRRIEK